MNHRDYALKSVFNEPGTGSYLGGLRLDQARDCKAFLDEAMYWKAPTENLNCGDVDGNIAIQSSALTPNRRGWDGRLPVPGTGKYEWDGFRAELPRRINPQEGYIATANNNINTTGYWPPVVFKTLSTVPTDRITRIEYVLNNLLMNRKFTIEDSEKLQHDPYSLRASYDQDDLQRLDREHARGGEGARHGRRLGRDPAQRQRRRGDLRNVAHDGRSESARVLPSDCREAAARKRRSGEGARQS